MFNILLTGFEPEIFGSTFFFLSIKYNWIIYVTDEMWTWDYSFFSNFTIKSNDSYKFDLKDLKVVIERDNQKWGVNQTTNYSTFYL